VISGERPSINDGVKEVLPMNWKKLGEIIATADGGCGPCVGGLTRKIVDSFPEIDKQEYKSGLLVGDAYWEEKDVDDWLTGKERYDWE